MQDVQDGVGSRRRMCKPLKGTLEHMGHSKGGGTGNYRGIDGDFPVAAKAQPKKLMQTRAPAQSGTQDVNVIFPVAALRGIKTRRARESTKYIEGSIPVSLKKNPNVHMEANNVSVRSSGGGTGTYCHVDGDVPGSMFQNVAGAKTFKVSGQEWQLAVGLLSTMESATEGIDSISFNAAISACVKGQEWQLALGLLSTTESPRERTDSISSNAAISEYHSTNRLKILTKNVQSILSEDRERDLLEEIETFSWDILLLTETWRIDKEEVWITGRGHMFLGAGWAHGRRGVAIVLHRRHKSGFKALQATSERA